MAQQTPQVDAVISALAEHDRAGALLIHCRATGKSLDLAWHELRDLQLQLGEKPDDLPAKEEKDPAYNTLRRHLGAHRVREWKESLIFAAVTLAVLALGALSAYRSGTKLVTSIRSLWWPTAEATVVASRTYSERYTRGSTYFSRDYMDFRFRYSANGREYEDQAHHVQYYDTFGDVPLRRGDTFEIPYDPSDPTFTLYERKLYHYSLWSFIGLVCFGVGLLLSAAMWSVHRDGVRLRRLDARLAHQATN